MNGVKKTNAHLGGFSSGTDLGGKVLRYRNKQNIYKQGALPTHSFIFKKAGCGLVPKRKSSHQPLRPSWGWVIFLAS